MAIARQAKRPCGLWVKMTAVTILGLCFIFVWTVFSSSSTSVTFQRESFEDIAQPVSSSSSSKGNQARNPKPQKHQDEKKRVDGSSSSSSSATHPHHHEPKKKEKKGLHKVEDKVKQNQGLSKDDHDHDPQSQHKKEEEEGEGEVELEGKEEGEGLDRESEVDSDASSDLVESVDQDSEELEDGSAMEEEEEELKKASKGKGKKVKGPLFDSNASYKWKVCSTRSKHNYIPCIDVEAGGRKAQSYRHRERSCPRTPLMCMVPLPHEGYGAPLPWPQSKLKVYEKIDQPLFSPKSILGHSEATHRSFYPELILVLQSILEEFT